MKVILKKNVEKLGVVGDVIKVADGYARNYLFPKDIAILATPKNLKLINQLKEAEEKRRAEELKEAEMILKQMNKMTCSFERLADENGHLYGSVSELDIAKALKEKGLTVDKNDVKMEKHIKDIGNHIVEIELQEDIKGQLKIKVKKQKEENTDEENS